MRNGVDVGLLSERQCLARNARRQETLKSKERQHRVTSVVTPVVTPVTSETPPVCHSPLQLLSDEHRYLIALIVAYQEKYDLPTDEDIRKVSVCLSVASPTYIVSALY